MQWGKKWGQDPTTLVHSYWGKLLNEVVQNGTFTSAASGTAAADCDTSYIVVPSLGSSVNTTFTWVDLSLVTHTLALRKPKFGNTTTVETEALVRRNKGKMIQVFKSANWPTFTSLKYTIEKMSQTDVNNLIAFLQLTLGLQVTLVDYLNRTWLGYFTTESFDITQNGQGNCQFEVSFEFLGVLQ